MFDIIIYDTREGEAGRINGVPGETLTEACRKVAERKGWRFVESDEGECYAIDEARYLSWGGKDLAGDAKEVEQGNLDEFRGLYHLYDNDVPEEDWED